MNWVDIVLLVILVLTLIMGIVRGLMRQIIGILSVVVGLLLAVNYYEVATEFIGQVITNEFLAEFLGFLTIFVLILLIGWLISLAVPRLLKGPFKGLDHILGGFFGFVKGVIICGILLLALMVFPFDMEAVEDSTLAPVCKTITKSLISLIPEDVKDRFQATYKEIFEKSKNHEESDHS